MYVQFTSCVNGDVISEFGIMENFIMAVGSYHRFQFLKSHFEFSYCQKIEDWKAYFKSTAVLE